MHPSSPSLWDAQFVVVTRPDLAALVPALQHRGFEVIGPVVRDGAIVAGPIDSLSDLPEGWTDEQDAGTYRLRPGAGPALFAYAAGAQPFKWFLHASEQRLFRISLNGEPQRIEDEPVRKRYAFLGLRSCDLHAIRIQDRVLLNGPYRDAHYQARREQAFFVAVNCTRPAASCFCASMDTGPRATTGFDLALTEIPGGDHRFLVETGSERGRSVLAGLTTRPATKGDISACQHSLDESSSRMRRAISREGLKEDLYASVNHPRWQQVASRCLACANCTMVCPTCFCTNVEETSNVGGQVSERRQRWDSCFTLAFSYIHGGSVRSSAASRYRQWLTHKLAYWQDQFGEVGCVGCGRCITWCPAGIDITEEVRELRRARRQAPP